MSLKPNTWPRGLWLTFVLFGGLGGLIGQELSASYLIGYAIALFLWYAIPVAVGGKIMTLRRGEPDTA